MRVWIVNNNAIPPSLGGLVRHFYFARELQKMGHRVRIITDSQVHNTEVNFVEKGQLMADKDFDGVTYTFVRGMSYTKNDYRRIFNIIQFTRNVKRAMKALYKSGEKPDVIYASSPSPFAPYRAFSFAKKLGIPYVYEERDLWPMAIREYGHFGKYSPIIPAIKFLEHCQHKAHRNSAASIFTIEGGKDYVEDMGWTDVDLDKIYYINNGVDLDEFYEFLESCHYEDPDLDDPETFKIVYTGSIRSIYHIDIIIKTADLIRNKFPQVRFFFYGAGPERDKLEREVRQRGLENFKFKGRVSKKEIPSILSRADMTLMHHEAVGLVRFGTSNNKLFEYLASGAPVLSTVKSGYSIVREDNCGIECPDQRPETIAKAIEKALSWTPEERAEIKKNMREVVKDFDFKYLSKVLEKILTGAIS